MKKFSHLFRCLAPLVLFFLFSISASAQVIRTAGIDSLVERTMKAFDVPGIAVAVVQGNRIVHLKGYGLRSLNTRLNVDANTLFGIASNSKAFTTAALGILADEHKLNWDDKVIDYIPEFRLYNPYVTEEFTIRDLLTHRSGLGLGAGDLMIWPGGNDFAVADIIHNLRYLKPVSGFRSKFDYDNLLYIVAGEVVARVSKMSWEDFIEERIMRPLGMTGSAATYSRIKDKSNVIDPHAPVDGVLQVIERDFTETGDAAGGIYSNINDMCKWIMMQMNHGKYGDNPEKQLFSKEVHDAMWAPNTIIPARSSPPYNTHFSSYGLGWFISDVKGYKQVSHTGGLGGMVTQVTLLPEKKLGIIVFTNQQSGEAFSSITNTIKDSYLGLPQTNWIKAYSTQSAGQVQHARKISDEIWKDIGSQQGKSSLSFVDSLYTGTYSDPWLGDVTLTSGNGKMWFEAKRSPKLSGEMFFYKGNTFVVKWKDRSMDADAFVVFSLDQQGKSSGMTMKAISPLTDFSYDFHDLVFLRKN
jgi:CubicO group peptidase (beta-lactamase class C family)